MAKTVLKSYKVCFETKFSPGCYGGHSYVEHPVDHLEVTVYAEDISDAINKAWQSVTISPQKYEIFTVTHEDHHIRLSLPEGSCPDEDE